MSVTLPLTNRSPPGAIEKHLAFRRPAVLTLLRDQTVQLNLLIKLHTMSPDIVDEIYCDPNSSKIWDSDLGITIMERFNKLIRGVELQAKGFDASSVEERRSVADVLREERLKSSTHPREHRWTDAEREALQSLLDSAQSKHRDITVSDTQNDEDSVLSQRHSSGTPGASKRARPSGRRDYPSSKLLSHSASPRDTLDIVWPSAEHGLFCLLRGFLIQGGERRRLTTAQLCEYVREWQSHNGLKLQRAGGPWNWISRTEDWSAIVPYALQFLTAETVPSTQPGASLNPAMRHSSSSRRLVCPRPFVDSKPRIHQWSWLLLPSSSVRDAQTHDKFEDETTELTELFAEWIRAPRGLGGFADAEWFASDTGGTGRSTVRRRAGRGSATAKDAEDDRDSDDSGRLQIIGTDDDLDADAPGRKQGRKTQSATKRRKATQSVSFVLDDSVPAPLCPTTWKLRPFSPEEKRAFQEQEAVRFSRPSSPFIYRIQDYTSVVGPLRSAPSINDHRANVMVLQPAHSRARDHPLLLSERPTHVSLAEIVRDAVACLPNGEGTRADITTLVQNSGFLLPTFNQRKLQQCVSSALDRLQGEASDPSVYFNAARRVWVYRHRHRTAEEFAKFHEARCAMNDAKRSLQRGDVRATSHSTVHHHYFRTPMESSYSRTHFLSPPPRGRQSAVMDHSNVQRLSGLPRSDGPSSRRMNDYDDEEEDALDDSLSDVHIPDIEELEAADMMRRARGGFSDYSDRSSSYDGDDCAADEDDYDDTDDYDLDNVKGEEFIGEQPVDYMSGATDYVSYRPRRPIMPPASFAPQNRRYKRYTSSADDPFIELHASLRR